MVLRKNLLPLPTEPADPARPPGLAELPLGGRSRSAAPRPGVPPAAPSPTGGEEEEGRMAGAARVGGQTAAAALECSPVPTAVLDASGAVTLWNAAAAGAFGLAAREVEGRGTEPGAWSPLLDAARRALRSHVPVQADVPWEAPDGRALLVHVSAAPLRGAGRRVTGVVCVLADVTEQRQVERTHERMLMLEQAARVRAEKAEQRAALLGYAGELLDAGFEHLQADAGPTLSALARLVVPTLADYCRVDLMDEAGAFAAPAVAHAGGPLPAGAVRPWPRGGRHPAARVVREGLPLLVKDASPARLRPLFGGPALRRCLP
ncbi:MAG TPA: PAS domain-containing protein, partial [Longimicrobium sp.]